MSAREQRHLDLHQPLDAASRLERQRWEGPEDTNTLISHLACSRCCRIYEAEKAGETLESLRREAYPHSELIAAVPRKCPRCEASQDRFAQECKQGPLGVAPERVPRTQQHPWDPNEDSIGVYCTVCNTVLGTLPPDPAAVAKYEEYMARLKRTIQDIRGG
jgi:hypothetical protein